MKISRFSLFRWIAIALVVMAVILLVLQLIQFSRIRAGFPPSTLIAGIVVGGLNQQQAADRVTQAYNNPIELVYKDQLIQVKPSQLGFDLNVEAMIAAADQQRVRLPFWSSFWDYLWNRSPVAHDTPLSATVDENRIRLFLMDEIASRYDEVPESSQPIPGTINFQIGKSGIVLNVDKSLAVVEQALQSSFNRSAVLVIGEVEPPRPSLENLGILIKQILDKSNFDGLTEVYVLDLENRSEINFAYEQGVDYDPGIAFTAASTVKIPIMVSTFKRLNEPTPQGAADLIAQMIEKSENPPADKLMETYLESNIGPIYVTQDMQEIGLKNTFLAGHFYLGAPLLQRYSTPANQRRDYFTDPDVYNQTTPSDIGMLLDDIYQCAQTGGGTFAAVFQGEISQSECQVMITYLTQNKIAVLLQAGIPDGTKIAHKHGWVVETDGVIHSIIDAGIIFSPGGNYVAVVAMYQPTQLIFDVANYLTAQISTAIYNYFNIS
ncbi:MAG: serine hydrolase [Pelolinea sp.]|nr:serine hydrolase [Pelolinea sp.]